MYTHIYTKNIILFLISKKKDFIFTIRQLINKVLRINNRKFNNFFHSIIFF